MGERELLDINSSELLTGADSNHLCFVRVQFEAIPAHPQINFLNTADKTLNCRVGIFSWRAEIDLCVIGVAMSLLFTGGNYIEHYRV
jgi:hypothetical protein